MLAFSTVGAVHAPFGLGVLVRWFAVLLLAGNWPLGLAAQSTQAGIPRAPGTDTLNLGFEVAGSIDPTTPAGWYTNGQGYEIRLDTVAPFAGTRSLRITGPVTPEPRGFGVASRSVTVARGAGGTVRLRGYIRTVDIGEGYAGLWLRTDAAGGRMLALENMSRRGIAGTSPWKAYEISLPLDSATVRVAFGVLHPGDGSAWFDSLSIDVDGRSLSDGPSAGDVRPATSLKGILARHAHGRPPVRDSLPGSWVMTTMISREDDRDGKPVESVRADRDGWRRADIVGKPMEWTMEIVKRGRDTLIAVPRNPWEPTGDSSTIRFRSKDMLLEKEEGEDWIPVWRCRTFATGWLACVDDYRPIWRAVEFRKVR